MDKDKCSDDKRPPFAVGNRLVRDPKYHSGGASDCVYTCCKIEWYSSYKTWIIYVEDEKGNRDIYYSYWFSHHVPPGPSLSREQCDRLLALLHHVRPYVQSLAQDQFLCEMLTTLEPPSNDKSS